MLIDFDSLLDTARAQGRAAGGFTCYDLVTGAAALRAAAIRRAPVVLLVSAQAFAEPTGAALVAGLRVLAQASPAPACVQLDHVADPVEIERALRAGVGAVMADGSRLGFEGNVALVRSAVDRARDRGAQVEAELGRIEGDEEVAGAADAGALTDPGQAAEFLARTGAHCLAVSIGNVHGNYSAPPRLDWDRLARIRATVTQPLSLHGASGLPAPDLTAAIAAGVAKVNVNTELRESWLRLVGARAAESAGGARLLGLQRELEAALAEVVGTKVDALGIAPQPPKAPTRSP